LIHYDDDDDEYQSSYHNSPLHTSSLASNERQRHDHSNISHSYREPSPNLRRHSSGLENISFKDRSKENKHHSSRSGMSKYAWSEKSNELNKSSDVKSQRVRTKLKPPIPCFISHKSTSQEKTNCNFIDLNRNSLWKQETLKAQPKERAKKQMTTKGLGKVPKYIEKRKKDLLKEKQDKEYKAEQERIEEAENQRGKLLPEKERIKILKRLRVKRNEAEFEFQKYSHNSFYGRRRQNYIDQICTDIDSLENMISKLENPNVYVLPDFNPDMFL